MSGHWFTGPFANQVLSQGPIVDPREQLTQGPDPSADAYTAGWLGKLLSRGVSGLMGGPSREEVLGPSLAGRMMEARTPEQMEGVASDLAAGFAGPIKAYHGSPHKFSKFDASKIGTGEGAQAYGHGLYFAEREGVARSYRDALANTDVSKMADGAPISLDMQRMIGDAWSTLHNRTLTKPIVTSAVDLVEENLMRQRADAMRARDMDWFNKIEDMRIEARRVRENPPKPSGHMYEVNINAEPHQFLDWDKPLTAQHPIVQEWARTADLSHLKPGNRTRVLIEKWRAGTEQPEYPATGQTIHNALSDYGANARPDLSAQLSQAGIPGIKYLDRGSRAAGDGSRNYVVFDPRIVDILKRYGFIGAAGASLGAEQ